VAIAALLLYYLLQSPPLWLSAAVEDIMSTIWIVVLAFVAGFLACAACVVAVILWSYSDKRSRGPASSHNKVWTGAEARIGEN